ncbi:hypothetical protein [Larkinella sp. C7]|uniref:hypothetical protein n=1 Tax=Larkinella sp. C7 TaxID=2576607 RepID=UPI00111132CE|nr:hypothetical protein [Larkinella sp. C7]
MKTIKSIALAVALLLAGSTLSFAQTSGHSHKATHGGTVQTAGDYHIEMVISENMLSFYLLDGKENTLSNKGITGDATFEFASKATTKLPLKTGDKDAFQVDVPKANLFAHCTVSLTVKGKTISSKFKNTAASEADIKHGHKH